LFDSAFTKDDNVELVMMPHNPFLTPEETETWHSQYRNMKLADKVTFLPKCHTHEEIAKIINNCDCGLFPSRAEGWNMELLESMACGKPVITTNYSAHTEYCTNKNSYLVEIDDLETADDGKFFFGRGEWAEIEYDQEEQIIEYMRSCYINKPFNSEGVSTAQEFNWFNTVEKLLSKIQ
jgi:glycosyltransferase involved in cell wall biosynthesis